MKKAIPFLLCLSLLLTACAALMPASALSADVTDSTWSDLDLQALVYQENMDLYSDLNTDYENYDWGWKEIPETNDEGPVAFVNMRGFAITPDRKYALMGHLNGGNFRGCALFDFETGTITDVFYRYDEEMPENICPFSYPKGIAADDRGNVYVGFAFCANFNVVNLGIAHINDETKTFEQLYLDTVCELGEPGVEAGGTQVGVNGVEVVKRGDSYYCYIMTNYGYDALYCYDVTDPSNPSLNKDFGDNGKIVFSSDDCTVKADGFTLDDGDYFAVDEEGVIWLAAKSKEGSRGVMKIAPDGSACIGVVNATNCYSVCRAGKYLIVGDKDGKLLHVYDASDTEQEIASIAPGEGAPEGSRFSRVQVIDDILFVVSNQENDQSQANAILAAALTADAQVELNKMAAQLTAAPAGDDNPDEPATGDNEPATGDNEPATGDNEPATGDNNTATEPATGDNNTATEPATGDNNTATEPATGDNNTATEPATGDNNTATEPATGDNNTATETSTGDASATETSTGDASATDTTAAAEDEGCSSVIGAGAAALVLSAMAAAVALKKRG